VMTVVLARCSGPAGGDRPYPQHRMPRVVACASRAAPYVCVLAPVHAPLPAHSGDVPVGYDGAVWGRWREAAVEKIEERVGGKGAARTSWLFCTYASEPEEEMHAPCGRPWLDPAC